MFLTSRQKAERSREGSPFYATPCLPDWHLTRPGSICFPLYVIESGNDHGPLFGDGAVPTERRVNGSEGVRKYLSGLGCDADSEEATAPWFHALAVGHAPAYLAENEDGFARNWPRIPLPDTRVLLNQSASLGREVCSLLDPETPVEGVTAGSIRHELRPLGVVRKADGGALGAGELSVTAHWGYAGARGIAMPGPGKSVQRPRTEEEAASIGRGCEVLGLSSNHAYRLLGESVVDIYLNDLAFWSCVPSRVWDYTLGGYQVLKKWLSYREVGLLGRPLTVTEAREFSTLVRRIAVLLLLQPKLDVNYRRVARNHTQVFAAP